LADLSFLFDFFGKQSSAHHMMSAAKTGNNKSPLTSDNKCRNEVQKPVHTEVTGDKQVITPYTPSF